MRKTILNALLAILFLANTATASALEVPRYAGTVNDAAGVMSPAALQASKDRIKAHEDKTGNQIAVLTIPSLEGEDIEGYADRVFKSWKPGKKGKDNGILLVVSVKDRRMRFEVGYGLEGTLPDSAAGEIIRTFMTPQFKQGDFNTGIDAGVAAVIEALENGVSAEDPAPQPAADTSYIFRAIVIILMLLYFGFLTVLGLATLKFGWFLYAFMIISLAMGPTEFISATVRNILLVALAILFPLLKIRYGTAVREHYKQKAAARRSGGDWDSSSDSSSSSSSDSSSSSSDSGGSSGGGGASGSW